MKAMRGTFWNILSQNISLGIRIRKKMFVSESEQKSYVNTAQNFPHEQKQKKLRLTVYLLWPYLKFMLYCKV
jgi:hypothetical protein